MTAYPVRGIDLSRWQPSDPSELGLSFVAVRACIGSQPDPMYATHVAHARALGLVVMAYDYGVNGLTGADQAARFLSIVGASAELVALDIEGSTAPTPQEARDWIAATDKAGKVPGVYHSLSGYPGALGQAFRWVAAWGTTPPAIPWDFWQDSDAGRFPGYAGPIDTDKYRGTLAELRTLARVPAPPHATPWELYVAPRAVVQTAAMGHGGCVDHFDRHQWGDNASSAACSAPRQVHLCDGSGTATVVLVASGVFRGKLVHLGAHGVTARPR